MFAVNSKDSRMSLMNAFSIFAVNFKHLRLLFLFEILNILCSVWTSNMYKIVDIFLSSFLNFLKLKTLFWIPTFDHILPVTSITANPIANYMFKVNNGNNTGFGLPFGSAAVNFFPFVALCWVNKDGNM